MSHRTKHRKEVKKYLRKKTARETKDAADERDRKLFLFADDLPTNAPQATTAEEAPCPCPCTHTARTVLPLLDAQPQKRVGTSSDMGEEKPSTASTAGGVSECSTTTTTDDTGRHDEDGELEFDFVFRTSEFKDAKDVPVSHDNAYGPGAHDEAIVSNDFYADVTTEEPRALTCCATPGAVDWGASHQQPGVCMDCIRIPDSTSVLTLQHKITSTLHVKYVDAVPALPMAQPLAPGTNLNAPTQNYMMVDCEHNLHQFSPGFQRDRGVAMRSIFGAAVKEWNDHPPKDSTVIVSTADAIRDIFQQAFSHDKAMGLYIRRVGPTLVVESRASDPTDVSELRAQSLLGKALYRIRDTSSLGEAAASTAASAASSLGGRANSSNTTTSSSKNNGGQPAADQLAVQTVETPCGVVAVPPVRVGSSVVSRHAPFVNRYSQTLLWEIDQLEVLVGVDTPIVVDRESCSRSMLQLRDESAQCAPSEMRRELLNCWFDATLANVPQVGVYVHKDGIVQRYELKKVHELLGLVEGRIATAAMSFTSNVLQWMVQSCARDGGTYAVVRDYDSDYLELYELPAGATVTQQLADPTEEVCEDDPHSPLSSPRPAGCAAQERAEREKLNLNLARMCLAMGRDIVEQDAGFEKAEKAASLLLRSLVIFAQHPTRPGVREQVEALVQLLPQLARQLVGTCGTCVRTEPSSPTAHDRPPSASPGPALFPQERAITPDHLRRALITCGKFEWRLRQAMRGSRPSEDDVEDSTSTTLVPCLIPCSAALCVVVARTLDLFSKERAGCTRLKRAIACLVQQAGGHRGSTTVQIQALHAQWRAKCDAAKDYLQVAAEGLLRLEHLSEGISQYCGQEVGAGDCSLPTEDVATAERDGVCDAISALTDSKRELNCCSLTRALSELYGDVVLLCLSDNTPFTVDVLHDIAKLITTREKSRHTHHSTTLTWLRDLTPDRISLSFTALRFYRKAGSSFRRHVIKVAQVHYYVGLKHFHDSRYTKALEALNQSLALFDAGKRAPCDEALGECFLGAGMVGVDGVQRALGDTYSRMAIQEARAQIQRIAQAVQHHSDGRADEAPVLPRMQPWQPLAIGCVRPLSKIEAKHCQHAQDAYERAGCSSDRARILIHTVAFQVGAACFTGEPLDSTAVAHLHSCLEEAAQLDDSVLHEYRELQLLRVFSAADVGAAPASLVQQAQTIALRWIAVSDEAAAAPAHNVSDATTGKAPSSSSASTTIKVERGGCECGPLVPAQLCGPTVVELLQGVALDDECGLTVVDVVIPAVEKALQLALTCLAMATATVASPQSSNDTHSHQSMTSPQTWLHQTLKQLTYVLSRARCRSPAVANTKDADLFDSLRLRIVAVCWGCASVRWWCARVAQMVLLRLFTVVRVLLSTQPAQEQTAALAVLQSVLRVPQLHSTSPSSATVANDVCEQLLGLVKATDTVL